MTFQQHEDKECYKKEKYDPRFVDNLLSKELLQLSLKDRTAFQEEVHGVHCMAPEETPELLEESLRQLAIELDKHNIPQNQNQKRAYNTSKRQERPTTTTYVNDDSFRLRFLRCELFSIAKTAQRIILFLQLVVELFGDFALQRPVLLSDFTEDELRSFRLGRYQFTPFLDRSGRRVLTIFPDEVWEAIPNKTKVRTV